MDILQLYQKYHLAVDNIHRHIINHKKIMIKIKSWSNYLFYYEMLTVHLFQKSLLLIKIH